MKRRFRHQNLRLLRRRRRFLRRSRWMARRRYGRARNRLHRRHHHLHWYPQSLIRWSRNARTRHHRKRVWILAKMVLATVAPVTSVSTIWAPLSLIRNFTARVMPARRVIIIITIIIMPAVTRHPRQQAGPRHRCCKISWSFIIKCDEITSQRSFLFYKKKIIYTLKYLPWNIDSLEKYE